jgi:hypothetical protein
MELVKDFIFDNDDIVIENGDFKLTESDTYHIRDIIEGYKGQYYKEPLIGVGIGRYDHASDSEIEIKREIKIQLESDNYKVDDITVEFQDDSLVIETKNIERIR